MKAIVSKSCTCQERNCPLYLVATFTVQVHSDSCFLSPREGYTSIPGPGEKAGEILFIWSSIEDSSVILDQDLFLYPDLMFEKNYHCRTTIN